MSAGAILETIAASLAANPLATALIQAARESGGRAWIVGGALRDAWQGRLAADFDFAAQPAALDAMLARARSLQAALIPLDPVRQITRAALGGHGADLEPVGESIEANLRRRDFTVNALALEVEPDRLTLYDPQGGLDDLERRRLRLCAPGAFTDDPARVIRAYRFMLTMDLLPIDATRNALRAAAPRAADVAAERVTRELWKILGHHRSHAAVERMAGDGALGALLPEVDACRGVTQNQRHHLDVFAHTLETLKVMEALAADPPLALRGLDAPVAADITRLSVAKLAALMHDTGKPSTRAQTQGRITFYGHETAGETMARAAARRLRLPRAVERGLRLLVLHHVRKPKAAPGAELDRRAMWRYLCDLGDWTDAGLLLGMADVDAARGPAMTPERRERKLRAAQGILALREKLERKPPRPPLDGDDLIREFNIAPGPLVGRLLEELTEANAIDDLTGRDKALAFIRDRLEKRAQ